MTTTAAADILYEPVEQVRALQERLLGETIDRCYRGHPFYREMMISKGLTPDDIRSVADLPKLPYTRKQEFSGDPERFRLDLPDLPLEERLLREVVYTTGTTTGRPAPIYNTPWDSFQHFVSSKRSSDIIGLQSTDVIANVFPLTPYPMGGYLRSYSTAAATGCAIFAANTGRPYGDFEAHRTLDDAVRLVETHRATVLYGVASFIRRMLIRAAELGVDFSSVRACMVTGEASSPAMREDMKRRMLALGQPDPKIWNRYGATESISLVECVEGAGWHNPAPDQILVEVVDPETGHPVPDGDIGLHVITHLNRRGTVLVRYSLGDLVAVDRTVCPSCGRTSERIVSQPVRTRDIVKIKGMLVNVEALIESLNEIEDLDEFQLVIRKSDEADPYSLDELVLRVAAPESRRTRVEEAAAARVLKVAQIRPKLEPAAANDLYNPERNDKPVRLVDRRPAHA